jgi:hypothetical protein
MHVSNATGTSAGVYTALNASVTAAMWTSVVSGAKVFQVDVLPLDGISPTTINVTGSPAKWTGNGGAVDFLPQGACLVKLQTLVRGPAHRGRLFLPFLSEQEQANGTMVAADLAVMQTAWNTFMAAMHTATYDLVVASYAHANATLVNTIVCESLIGTQKRRQNRNRRS